MTTRRVRIPAMVLSLMSVAGLSAQPTVTRASLVTATATIQAIDPSTRTIKLRDETGHEEAYTVGPDVERFSELKVGDTVKMSYYESIVFQIRQPGDEVPASTLEAALGRAKGALPAGTLAVQEKMTVTVKAIDLTVPSVTVTTADGRTVTRKVEERKHLEGLKPGDQVDITYSRALVASLERAK